MFYDPEIGTFEFHSKDVYTNIYPSYVVIIILLFIFLIYFL